MKKMVKIVLMLAILTAVYISSVVYANASSKNNTFSTLYSAILYKSEPSKWYYPEQLGIVEIIDYGAENATWVHVVVPPKLDPGDLDVERPVFIYKGRFYQIAEGSINPGLHETVERWQILIGGGLGAGWIFVGALILRKRKNVLADSHNSNV